jgi:hypothetical protein
VFLTRDYVIASVVFSVFIGVVTVILEWGVPRKPADTFMAALSLPALISGMVNTTSVTGQLHNQLQENQALTRALSREADIPILRPSGARSDTVFPGPWHARTSHHADLVGLAAAQADDGDRRAGTDAGSSRIRHVQLPIQIQQPRFAIVLDRATSAEDARRKAEVLRQSGVPDAQAAQVGRAFVVMKGDGPRPQSEALLEAVRLKNEQHLTPSLVEWKEVQPLR